MCVGVCDNAWHAYTVCPPQVLLCSATARPSASIAQTAGTWHEDMCSGCSYYRDHFNRDYHHVAEPPATATGLAAHMLAGAGGGDGYD